MKPNMEKPQEMAGGKAGGICGVLILLLAVTVLVSACSPGPEPDPRLGQLVDRFAVQDAVNELFKAADLKDWRRARVVFTEKVNFDMPDLIEGGPAEISAKDIVDAWSQWLGPMQEVHQQTGNFVVKVLEFGAYVTCYVTATHYHPEQQETVAFYVGSYDFHLVRKEEGWKIDAMRFRK